MPYTWIRRVPGAQKLAPVFFEGVLFRVTCFLYVSPMYCHIVLSPRVKVLQRGLCFSNIECRRNLRFLMIIDLVLALCVLPRFIFTEDCYVY